ncbi:hypothetical protein [Halobacillus sp. K22]|uniref:hypothetical protein n=1 Tax=Halobacillus sp. K22 TaxID=3457431 RepID=UPI003FCD20CC
MNGKIALIIGILVIACGITGVVMYKTSPAQQAKAVVVNFYSFEQRGEYSDSWQLFHPLMKEKFAKGPYIQDRAHVFMNHFGVDTFSFSVEEIKKIKNWRMEKGAKPFPVAYSMTVAQTFRGKYGLFTLNQKVVVTREKDKWVLTWDYHKK